MRPSVQPPVITKSVVLRSLFDTTQLADTHELPSLHVMTPDAILSQSDD